MEGTTFLRKAVLYVSLWFYDRYYAETYGRERSRSRDREREYRERSREDR